MSDTKTPTTPAAHYADNHADDCGCWLSGGGSLIRCKGCKVDYLALMVMEFSIFCCYDCGGAIYFAELDMKGPK